jgi:hypothetical protein
VADEVKLLDSRARLLRTAHGRDEVALVPERLEHDSLAGMAALKLGSKRLGRARELDATLAVVGRVTNPQQTGVVGCWCVRHQSQSSRSRSNCWS